MRQGIPCWEIPAGKSLLGVGLAREHLVGLGCTEQGKHSGKFQEQSDGFCAPCSLPLQLFLFPFFTSIISGDRKFPNLIGFFSRFLGIFP